jgi:hypothetical protein
LQQLEFVSRDKTYVVGAKMLGDQYYGAFMSCLQIFQKFPRPYKDTEIASDTFGDVIAWPKILVSTFSFVKSLHYGIRLYAHFFYKLYTLQVKERRNLPQTRQTNNNLVCYILLIFLL